MKPKRKWNENEIEALADPAKATALGEDANDLTSVHHDGVRVILDAVAIAVVEPHMGSHLVATLAEEPHDSGVTPHKGANAVVVGAVRTSDEAVESEGANDGVRHRW